MSTKPAGGVSLLGNVVSWTLPTVTVPLEDLHQHLREAGLDPGYAVDLEPKQAFAKAVRKLEGRIAREMKDKKNKQAVRYQLTAETKGENYYEYEFETFISCDVETGEISCPSPEIVAEASLHYADAMTLRGAGEINRIIDAIFGSHERAVPLRDKGGVYFLAIADEPLVERVESLLAKFGGRLSRFPVPAGRSLS